MKAALLLALAACASTPAANHASGGSAVVIVTSNVSDAQVWVDGRFIGPLSLLRKGLAIDAGHHRLELRHDEYFSRYADLDVKRAERRTLDLAMAPQLP